MRLSPYWNAEDTFFGAILGAILGSIINSIHGEYLLLAIAFFIVFPPSMRKAENRSGIAISIVAITSIIWIIMYTKALAASEPPLGQNKISVAQTDTILYIYCGWILASTAKIILRRKW